MAYVCLARRDNVARYHIDFDATEINRPKPNIIGMLRLS